VGAVVLQLHGPVGDFSGIQHFVVLLLFVCVCSCVGFPASPGSGFPDACGFELRRQLVTLLAPVVGVDLAVLAARPRFDDVPLSE
jgi:hypothetical protein